jgi:hypothetical protein
MGDLDHALESQQAFLIQFIAAQQFGVIAEIAQELGELPQRLGRAVEASGKGSVEEWFRLKNAEANGVIGLLFVPAVLYALDPDQVQAIGDFARGQSGLGEARKAAFHAAQAFDAIRRKTAQGPYEAVNYHRFADDSAPRRRGEETAM